MALREVMSKDDKDTSQLPSLLTLPVQYTFILLTLPGLTFTGGGGVRLKAYMVT
jgi:hypothetical protein